MKMPMCPPQVPHRDLTQEERDQEAQIAVYCKGNKDICHTRQLTSADKYYKVSKQ